VVNDYSASVVAVILKFASMLIGGGHDAGTERFIVEGGVTIVKFQIGPSRSVPIVIGPSDAL